MQDDQEPHIRKAIDGLSQADPIVKLLQQVKLGRMKPTDAGLRAITESWLGTYRQVLQSLPTLTRGGLRRLDPGPRLDVLAEVGVVAKDHPMATELRRAYDQVVADAKA